MLLVVSKEKILSYMIAFSTVAILIGTFAIGNIGNKTIETGTVVKENSEVTNQNNTKNME